MDRLLMVAVVACLAGLVAAIAQRWRPGGRVTTGWSVPEHIDRGDFDKPDVPWLVAVFSAADCATCRPVVVEAHSLASADVAVQEVSTESATELHNHYRVDAVPLLLVADEEGLVRAHHLGPSTPGQLREALERARTSRVQDRPEWNDGP